MVTAQQDDIERAKDTDSSDYPSDQGDDDDIPDDGFYIIGTLPESMTNDYAARVEMARQYTVALEIQRQQTAQEFEELKRQTDGAGG